ncbi:MAG TPA: AsmA family protein [Magnetovibrio sp.]
MKAKLKILGVVFVVLIASIVSIVALVTQYDYNQLKPLVIRMTKDATGRDLTINGDLHLIPSLTPTLSVSDITLANAPWGEKDAMVRLDNLEAKLDLQALLQGQVDVEYLVLDGLKVLLQTDGKGNANWEFETPGAKQTADALADAESVLKLDLNARDVRLLDVDLTYVDGATNKRVHVFLPRADFKADGFNAPIHATLMAAYGDVMLDAEVDMGSLSLLVGSTGEAFPVNMEITAPGLRATVDGSVEQPHAGMTVDAHMDVTVSDSEVLDQLAGAALPDLAGLRVQMKVRGQGTDYAFTAIDARLDESDIGGEVRVNMAAKRPRLVGKLTSKVMDLDQIFDLEPWAATASDEPLIASSKPEGEPVSLFTAEPLPFELLSAADLDIDVLTGRLRAFGFTIDALKAGINVDGGTLDLKPLSFSLEDGDIQGAVHLDAAPKTPTLNVETTVKGLDVGRIIKVVGGSNVVSLVMDGHMDLASKGESSRALMGGLNGTTQFSARDGRINDEYLKDLASLTKGLSSVLPWVQHKDASVISCLVGHWPVKDGVATAQAVLMDTPGFTVAVTGNVDLGGERLHLTITPQAKNTSLASFAVPVRLKGALTAPYTGVDPGDAVVGTVGNIFKAPVGLLTSILTIAASDASANDPCLKALSGGKTPDTPTPPEEKKQPLKPVEDLGKALGDLLKK